MCVSGCSDSELSLARWARIAADVSSMSCRTSRSGCTIGIISHVGKFQEDIRTQIEVVCGKSKSGKDREGSRVIAHIF